MTIREMRKEDLESFLDCEARIWETLRDLLPEEFVERNISWSSRPGVREAWARVMDDPGWIVLVAVEGDSVVGFVQGSVDWSRLSTLGFLGVDEGHRRKGIARALVDRFLEESKSRDAAKVTLFTSPTLKPAVKLYADMGFVPEGFLSRHRLGVDMIVYSKFLS
ncbi:GNAT family N-acetyltransferase [Candidatus Bathyarchaeota archaeon]|nr:GNAT family N-acetyltransferase [Candidatus Bathyarchaeota archaeon]